MDGIKKVVIVSNNICYGPAPEIGAEVEQRLTINSKGQIWLTGRNYQRGLNGYSTGRRIRKTIPKEDAIALLNDICRYFEEGIASFVTDVGCYTAFLFFETETKEFNGSLYCGEESPTMELCRRIRSTLTIDNLFIFDGNYDEIT